MLNNITIGQYFPAKSVIHRADPRIKILVTLLLIVTLFMAGNFTALLLCGGFTILSVLLTKIPLKMYLKTLKAIWMILFFIPVINTLFGLWILYRKLSNFKEVKKYFKINIKSIIETLKNI